MIGVYIPIELRADQVTSATVYTSAPVNRYAQLIHLC
jgi:hypothetical protein